jgi:6-pyruvoyltetrahydropterin/6-carboxytetrahydropterin synthase
MVLDFVFLKDLMMRKIHYVCDHAFAVFVGDPLLRMFVPDETEVARIRKGLFKSAGGMQTASSAPIVSDLLDSLVQLPEGTALVGCSFIPTAEELARSWFFELEDEVRSLSEGRASLHCVRVWETPNCVAEFFQ